VRTVEGIVHAHQLATERRRQGKPIWAGRLNVGDLFHNDGLTFIEKRDAIVARIKATRWYKDADPHQWDGRTLTASGSRPSRPGDKST
jgi:hypothetical protein